ncbi:hypothetical protein [Atlantibacter hermannii]|uniref:hypothetical protein n=1 Tax=Atlantibacter hermannii TaxID=565 RepID=UPI0028B0AD5C|nr:hypothetical protein [Atlantibacter hermannii]
MEESRKQFEAWFKSDYHPDKTGPYLKDAMFFAWQASRAAIEIDLPPTTEVHPLGPSTAKMFCELHKNTVAECAKAIRAAGLTVKGDSK